MPLSYVMSYMNGPARPPSCDDRADPPFWFPTAARLLEGRLGEDFLRQRGDVRRVHVLGEGDGRRGGRDRNTGEVLHDGLVGLLVRGGALLGLAQLRAGVHGVEDLLVLEAPLLVVPGEPGADEVEAVVEVTGPAEHVQVA